MIVRALRAALRYLASSLVAAEGWWFDRTRNVDTGGYIALETLTTDGSAAACFDYLPTRPSRVRQALSALGLDDFSQYSFVDLGSGKGRVLFVAAEYSFCSITGIEFSRELHETAVRNTARFLQRRRSRCRQIESLHRNATHYQFPSGNLIVYLFNPFGPEVMDKVFDNLARTLATGHRQIFVVLMNPEFSAHAAAQPWLQPFHQAGSFHIYKADPVTLTQEASQTR